MVQSMKKIAPLLVLLMLFIVGGCAHDDLDDTSPETLLAAARSAAEGDHVDKAAEYYLQVRTYYPGDVRAREALLLMADMYYDHERYAEALGTYSEFQVLYPTDPEAAYCLYRIGLCYFSQRLSPDRDQTRTTAAITTFDEFLRRYPTSPYVDEVQARRDEARLVVARHDLAVARYYLKKKNYAAACERLQELRDAYGDLDLDADLEALQTKACSRAAERQ